MPLDKNKTFPTRSRLSPQLYLGIKRYFVTINTHNRERIFTNDDYFQLAKKVLVEICEDGQFFLWVFCFMPDHVHLLLEGVGENSDLQRFIKMFKQKSGYVFKQQKGMRLWSTSFYDHILRREEATIEVVKYILNNPVRKRLVDFWYKYPYSGSFELKKEDLL